MKKQSKQTSINLDCADEQTGVRNLISVVMKGLEAVKETGLSDVKHAWANFDKVLDASACVAGITFKSKGFMA